MRNLVVISTEKLFLLRRGISLSFRQRSCFYFDEESLCHSDREVVLASMRNLVVIPTEKLFLLRRGIYLSFRHREVVFTSTRNLLVIPTVKDSSVAKSSFRMTVAFCHPMFVYMMNKVINS